MTNKLERELQPKEISALTLLGVNPRFQLHVQ